MAVNSAQRCVARCLMSLSALLASAVSVAADAPTPTTALRLMTFIEQPLVQVQDDRVIGPMAEVIAEIFRRAGDQYAIDVMPAKRALLTAQSKEDYCVFPIERSQEREATLRWISPILVSRHGIYALQDSNIELRTLSDAHNYRLVSYLGSGAGEYLENMGFNVHLAAQNEQALAMLGVHRVDLWVSDTYSVKYLEEKTGVTVGEPKLIFFTTIRAMGCHPDTDPERLAKLQQALISMYKDGSMRKMLGFDIARH